MRTGRGIAYVFAVAGSCLATLSGAQQQVAAQPGVVTISTPSHTGGSSYRRPPNSAILLAHVSVSLSGLPLEKAVEMLTKASGTRIQLDRSLKINALVTIDAHQVPLYKILEALTHQPGIDLMISPDGNAIRLEPWPTLEVNGKREQYRGANAPWSDEWDSHAAVRLTARTSETVGSGLAQPTSTPLALTESSQAAGSIQAGGLPPATTTATAAESPFGQTPRETGGADYAGRGRVSGTNQTPVPAADPFEAFTSDQFQPSGQNNGFAVPGGPVPTPAYPPPAMPGMGSGMGVPAGYSLNSSLSVMVTALSDKSFVVTEPGLGPKNEAGVYLTVYRVEGDKIREVSHVFHRSANGGRAYVAPAVGPNRMMGRGMMMSPGGRPVPGANSRATTVLPPVPPSGPPQPGANKPAVVPSPGERPTTPPAPQSEDETAVPVVTPRASIIPADPTRNRLPAGDVLGGGKSSDDPFDEK